MLTSAFIKLIWPFLTILSQTFLPFMKKWVSCLGKHRYQMHWKQVTNKIIWFLIPDGMVFQNYLIKLRYSKKIFYIYEYWIPIAWKKKTKHCEDNNERDIAEKKWSYKDWHLLQLQNHGVEPWNTIFALWLSKPAHHLHLFSFCPIQTKKRGNVLRHSPFKINRLEE